MRTERRKSDEPAKPSCAYSRPAVVAGLVPNASMRIPGSVFPERSRRRAEVRKAATRARLMTVEM